MRKVEARETRGGELPEDRTRRSSLGYRNVRNLKGGLGEWVRKGQPVEESAVGAS